LRKKRVNLSVFFIAFGVLASAGRARADCQCPPTTHDEQLKRATYVFTATVYDVQKPKHVDRPKIIFDVDDIYKGQPDSHVEATDDAAGTDCALDFKEGQEYMVYARWDWANIVVSSCTGTTPIDPFSRPGQALGPSDAWKEKLYKKMWENCLGTTVTMCCLSSLKAMQKGRFLPQINDSCPDDMAPDRLKCNGSLVWCIPLSDDMQDHRHSKK